MRLILDTRRAMFSTLRIVAVIGAIFYLSPVRQPGTDAGAVAADTLAWALSFLPKAAPAEPKPPAKSPAKPAAPSADPGTLEALWRNLPEGAKKAMLDQLVAGAREAAAPASLPHATDTLQPEDLQPAWKGDGRKKG